jgi:hypothetical protein
MGELFCFVLFMSQLHTINIYAVGEASTHSTTHCSLRCCCCCCCLQMRWRSELPPPLQGRKSRSSQGGAARADVVVASYVLGEVSDPQQRAALIRHLWSE